MRINHNISALKANNLLNANDNKLSRNLEKLTSGLKINHASDDAAGMAISQKMKTQIAGLSKASTNASDGISVIQTAEGALEEVNSCLQRMRELSVQAANGIYTTDDRIAIQKEIDALNAEITRISETTEFNTRNLLDGSIDRKSFSNSTSISIVSVSDTVPTADGYKIKISQDARQAVLVGDTLDSITDISQKITKTQEGKININGLDIVVNEGDTYDEVFKQLRDTCADLDIYCFATEATIESDTTTYGQDVYAGYRAEKFGVGTTGKSVTAKAESQFGSTIVGLNVATLTDPQEIFLTVDNTTYTGTYTDKGIDTGTGKGTGELASKDGKIIDIEYTPSGTTAPITITSIDEVKIYEPMNVTVGNIDESTGDFSNDISTDNGATITIDGIKYGGKYTYADKTFIIQSINDEPIATPHDVITIKALSGNKPSSVAISRYSQTSYNTTASYTLPATFSGAPEAATGFTDASTSATDATITVNGVVYTGNYDGSGNFTITKINGQTPSTPQDTITIGSSFTGDVPDSVTIQQKLKVGTIGSITIDNKTYNAATPITKEGKNAIKLTTQDEEVIIYHTADADPTQNPLNANQISKVVINRLEKFSLPKYTFESSLEPGKDKFLTIKNGTFSDTYTGTLTVDEADPKKMTLRSYDGNVFDIETTGSDPISVKSVVKRSDINPSQRLAFVSYNYGSDEKISILCNNPELSKLFGLSTNTLSANGIDAKAELLADPDNGFSNTATVSIYGNKVTISDNNNFEMVIETNPGTANTVFTDNVISSTLNDFSSHSNITADTQEHTAVFTVLDAGPLSLQIGANAYQTMEVSIPAVTPKILGVDTVNVGTENGAQKAITAVSAAINTVSAIRAKLGAFQNRLEHAISNLDTTNENMTESLSRVEDTDMASEMAAYTQNNILVQAGTSMLAQANQQPQNILSLLKG